MELKFELDSDQANGRFYLETAGERKAVLEVLITETGRLVIKHTEVHRDLEGQGVGRALLDATVNYAREKNFKILPICPYAKAVMNRHPEKYREVMV